MEDDVRQRVRQILFYKNVKDQFLLLKEKIKRGK